MEFQGLVMLGLKVVVCLACLMVAFSSNILYAAFSLMATFACVAVLYVLGGSDLLAGAQVIVYMGGILVVILFAIMLSHRIYNIPMSIQFKRAGLGVAVGSGLIGVLFQIDGTVNWKDFYKDKIPELTSAVEPMGNALLKEYVFPFEAVSILLLVSLVGSMVLSRPREREKGSS